MTFLAPWFLLGLLAAAIPLALHLRRQRRAQTITFSTNQFFDERFLRASRRARLQDLLLMMLRMALLALLALALAQPLVRTSGWGLLGAAGGARHIAIVIDDSASMGVHSRDGLLLDRARNAALELLDELAPARGDRATVVLAGLREAGPRVLFDEATPQLDQVRDVIRRIEVTDLAGDLDAAAEAAARALGVEPGEAGSTSGQREVYVFSDFQDASLRPAEAMNVGPDVGVMLVATRPAADEPVTNLAVDAVQYGAARPMVGVPFHFRARVTNHGHEPATATVDMVIGDTVINQRDVDVPAGRSALVRFTHRFTDAGWFGGRFQIAGMQGARDMLVADDARHFAVHVEDRVRVLAVNGAPSQVRRNDELFFLRLALSVQAGAAAGEAVPVRVDELRPDELADNRLGEHALVVLANVADLSDDALDALERYIDRGGSVLVTLGDRVRPDAYNTWLGEHRLHGGLLPARLGDVLGSAARNPEAAARLASLDAADDDDAGFIAAADEGHPMLAGFGAGQLGSFASVRFTGRYELAPAGGADVLMRDAAGQPVLVERSFGRGRVMLFASSIDRDWTSFPLQPTYVPWLYRVVGYLSQQTAPRGNFIRTGQIVALPGAATETEAWRIDGPAGVGYPQPDPRRTAGGRASQTFVGTDHAGVYAVHGGAAARGAPPARLFAANVPSEVSRLAYLDRANLEARLHPQTAMAYLDAPEQIGAGGATARQGLGLWNALLWGALLVALFEPWLANRLSKRRASQVRDALGQRDQLPGAGRREAAAMAGEREAETVGAA